jgi:SAM-dependent methyltransferase
LLGFAVHNYEIDVPQYQEYFAKAHYQEDYATYYKSYLVEKSLEHYIAAELLRLNAGDIYIDIASQNSPAPGVYRTLFGARVYRQDLIYPHGVRGDMIGGDAASMPVPDDFATKMALHCSFEHFERTSDSGFVREALRALRPGGTVCIVPFYMSESYSIQTDPVVSIPSRVAFEDDAVVYCAQRWDNRYGRFYDPRLEAV